jgi:crotonobetainyl-CoA:carnitine CoA-transferase CaiB-like acyl-CoA transferase
VTQSRPLEGLRVLDFSWNLPGPYTTMVLASMGATVWKIEPPRGDPARHVGRLFELLNRGKRSLVLDLSDPVDQGQLPKLVAESDVLVEGFRPGVIDRLGCSRDQAMGWNPSLVWCSISAFGQAGPGADKPGHDLNLQALSGLSHLERERSGDPRAMVLPVADLSAAMAAVSEICAALVAKERHGHGAVLDIAMADTLRHWTATWSEGVDLLSDVRHLGLGGRAAAASPWFSELRRRRLYALPHYGLGRCRDGVWLALGIVDEKHFWKGLCRALSLRGVGRLSLPARTALGPVLGPLIRMRMATRSSRHWLRVLSEADVPITPVLTPEEAQEHPWLVGRRLYASEGEAPALGEANDSLLG